MSDKQDWLDDLIGEIPLDTMDYAFLIEKVLPKLGRREIRALLDAMNLCRRDGLKGLKL